MISVKHLTKCYGEFTAVDDLSFEIDEGHVYGFLGPNGAGKSTTMNIITGCLSATSGQVTIDGHDIFEEPKEAKRAIGYLPEIPPLYTNETPEEYLKFVAEAKGLKGKEMDRQIEGVISQTRIQNVRKRLISKLSKGYKKRKCPSTFSIVAPITASVIILLSRCSPSKCKNIQVNKR